MRLAKLSFTGRATKPCTPFPAGAGKSLNRAVFRTVNADPMVLGISDQNVASVRDAEMFGTVQPRTPGVPAIARIALLTGAGDGADLARSVNDPERMPRSLQNIQFPWPSIAMPRDRPVVTTTAAFPSAGTPFFPLPATVETIPVFRLICRTRRLSRSARPSV